MSNPGPGNVAGPSGAKGASPGLKAPRLTATESQELLKPLVFGNYQRHFRIFSAIVSAGVAYYMVFHHDFGPKRHVFTWVREWKERRMKEIFYIDPNDIEVQRMKRERKQVITDSRSVSADSGHTLNGNR